MSALYYLIIILAAPIYYWVVGVALASFRKPSVSVAAYAGLLGILAHGFLGEFSLIAGINYSYLLAIMLCAVAIATFVRRDIFVALLPEFWRFLFYYLIAALAATIALFPVPGPWSGDWFENYRLGQSVLSRVMNPDLIGRTPVFGAASLPIAMLTDGLCGLQIANALTCAAAAMAMRGILQVLSKNKQIIEWSLLILCFSGVYLQHSAFPWAKMLAAGCIFAAAGAILRAPMAVESLRNSSLWLAAAIAVHQAAILFVPVVWCINLLFVTRVRVRWWIDRIAALGVAVVVITLPYEIFTISVFGWQEKIHRNPTVYFRTEDGGYVWNTIEVLVNTFIPDPRFFAEVWTSPRWDYSLRQAVTRIFFTDLYYITSVAGTLLLALLPFFISGKLFSAIKKTFRNLTPRQIIFSIAIGAAILGNALLSAYTSPVGTAQAGLTPLAVAAVGAAAMVASAEREVRFKTTVTVFLMQTLPWFALQGVLLFVVQRSDRSQPDGAWMRLFDRDTDFHTAIEHFNSTLALHVFPLQVALCVLAIIMWKKVAT